MKMKEEEVELNSGLVFDATAEFFKQISGGLQNDVTAKMVKQEEGEEEVEEGEPDDANMRTKWSAHRRENEHDVDMLHEGTLTERRNRHRENNGNRKKSSIGMYLFL